MADKRILVTGGAGFIGANLCRQLLGQGHEVICVDNLFTGTRRNLTDLLGNRNFVFVEHDITEPLSLQCEYIYNLACPASPIQYQSDPVKTITTSVLGAINVLELARQTGARVLQASTSEIYGDPEVHPQAESYWGNVNPVGIRSCYDEGKRCAETLFMDYHRQYGIDIKIVRIFNTYGPFMSVNDGRVVSNFIVQALRGEDLTIYGDGQQSRSFCYVDDTVAGMIKMMESAPGFTGPVNLGNAAEITVRELAETVLGLTESRSKLVFKTLPMDDPRKRKPDLRMAQSNLDWEAVVDLEAGLRRTITYFKGVEFTGR